MGSLRADQGTLEFDWIAMVGPHTFKAIADSREDIKETNDANNTLEETVVTALSDLVVTDAQIVDQDTTAGDEVRVSVSVQNSGRGISGGFKVSLHVNGENEPYVYTIISSLERNEIAPANFRWQAVEGCHRLRVVVDTDRDVPEENEGNNQSVELEICARART